MLLFQNDVKSKSKTKFSVDLAPHQIRVFSLSLFFTEGFNGIAEAFSFLSSHEFKNIGEDFALTYAAVMKLFFLFTNYMSTCLVFTKTKCTCEQ